MSMFIFGVVLAALTGLLVSSAHSIGDQRLRTAATRLATDRLETLRSLPFDDLDVETGDGPPLRLHGADFTVKTLVTPADADTAGVPIASRATVKNVTVTVRWESRGSPRQVAYTTARAPDKPGLIATPQAIGAITMFPSPAVTDATGRPEADIEVTVPLEGFPVGALVALSWDNADGTAGAQTLTSTSGLNWRGTIARAQIRAAMGADGRGEVQFRISAGALGAVYTLSLQVVAARPPAIIAPTIDRSPVAVAKPTARRTCADRNQCQNTTDVTFSVTATGLDATQDSVILQYQLYDGSSQEVPLTPVGDQWRVTVRQKTTKFLAGASRSFRFTAIRSVDGATVGATVSRDVIST